MTDLFAGCAVSLLALVFIVLPAVLIARMQDKGTRCIRPRPGLHPLRRARALLATVELRLHWWDWRPVRAHWHRQYKRADRKALAAEMGITRPAGWDRIRAGMRPAPRLVDTSRTLAQIHAAEDGPIVTGAEVDEEFERMPPLVPMSPDPAVKPGVGWQVPDDYRPRPVNGRYLGTQPRRTPYPSAADPVTPVETDDDPPWDIETAQQDAVPAYGVASCQLDVDEARRQLAVRGPAGCEETARPLGLADLGSADPRPFSERVTTN